jgi:transcriptional regulator with PAS, ATPase and Fis domain
VVSITLPALRDRLEDLQPLVQEILLAANRKFKRRLYGISPAGLAVMQNYSWPGNVRELRNVIERAFFVEKGALITPRGLAFPDSHPPEMPRAQPEAVAAPTNLDEIVHLNDYLEAQERLYILKAFDRYQHNVTRTAQALGLARVTLQRKLKQMKVIVQAQDGETDDEEDA